jgi:hypothetical protein
MWQMQLTDTLQAQFHEHILTPKPNFMIPQPPKNYTKLHPLILLWSAKDAILHTVASPYQAVRWQQEPE